MKTKKELKKALDDGKTIYNHVWWFCKTKNGIVGGCNDDDCCHFVFETFNDMYEAFLEEDWEI